MTVVQQRDDERSVYVNDRGYVEHPLFGFVQRVQIGRIDGAAMTWSQVQDVFNDRFPEQWALEVRPPARCVVDEINAYHLWVLPEGVDPEPLRIDNRPLCAPHANVPRGTTA